MISFKRFILATSLLLTTAAIMQNAYADSVTYTNPQDPYEHFNRAMFKFDMKLDDYVLKPVSRVYIKVLPQVVREKISNFYNNLDNTTTIVNDALQGNFYQTTSDSWRFLINSTIGLAGFFDPATSMGLANNSEDFGLTLAKWGYTNSNYLVLPLFGPSTVRDTIGMPPNYFTSIYPYINNSNISTGVYAVSVVSKNAELLQYQNIFQQAAIDQYVFVRSAYLQRRNNLIARNNQLNDPYTTVDRRSYQLDPLLSQ